MSLTADSYSHTSYRAYIKMLGGNGLSEASKVAMLNANYMMARLKDHYRVKFTNENGRCAHEFIIDLAEFDQSAGLSVMDFAKRIQVCLPLFNVFLFLTLVCHGTDCCAH